MNPTSRHNFNAPMLIFLIMHLSLIGVFFVPFSAEAFWLVVGTYFGRMFFVTSGYHRYFSHRSFSTSRIFQGFLAFMALTSSQKGILWWAAHHRTHHRHSDQDKDIHSPNKGFFWSHCGWFLSREFETYDPRLVRDLAEFPELRWLSRYWALPVLVYGLALLAWGGWNYVYWGFCVSTVLLWHGTFTINSLSHTWGHQRYGSGDQSRNNALLALLTLGEGWHNNHHRFPRTSRSGFFWWEVDPTYYGLKLLSLLKIVWNLQPVTAAAYGLKSK